MLPCDRQGSYDSFNREVVDSFMCFGEIKCSSDGHEPSRVVVSISDDLAGDDLGLGMGFKVPNEQLG